MKRVAPTAEFERLVLDGQIAHGGDPILRWMTSNISVRTDAAGNIKPDKRASTEKIDGIVAAIMALGRAMVQEALKRSVYEERGGWFCRQGPARPNVVTRSGNARKSTLDIGS